MTQMDGNLSVHVECKSKKGLDAEKTDVPSARVHENKAEDHCTLEELLVMAGTDSIWNHGFVFLIFLYGIPEAFMLLSYQFLGATPDYWCQIQELHDANWTTQQIIDFAIPRKADGELERCLQNDYNYPLAASMGYEEAMNNLDFITNVENGTVACSTRDFNLTQYSSTLVTDFDLVCERRALYSTTSSILHIGKFVASFIVGYITDQFGKRRVILVCHLFSILFGALMAMSPAVEIYILCKFFFAVFRACTSMATFPLVLELSSNTHRSYTIPLKEISWSLGQMLLPSVAHAIREWKLLQIIFIAPYLYTISYYWVLPESPRWLILRGRHEEAVKVFKTIAYWNKGDLPSDEKLLEMVKNTNIKEEHDDQSDPEKGAERSRVRFLDQFRDLFQTKLKTQRTFVLIFCWFTSAFVYQGTSLMSTTIGANVYWYMFFGGLAEMASGLLNWCFIHTVGRRLSLVGFLSLCAASTLGILGAGASPAWKSTLSLLGKFGASAATAIVMLLANEINTTKSRTLATGISAAVACLGSSGAPYVNDLLGDKYSLASPMMFGALSCTAAFLALILPETRKANLPESLYDVENIGPDVKTD